jgi:hypothetical protein
LVLAGTALAAPTFSNVGGAKLANWSWDNGDPAIGGGSNGNISAILVSDSLGSACFAGNTGPQLQTFYSAFSGGAWSTPKNLSGNTFNADRGTLVTSGANVYAAYSSQVQYYNAQCTKLTFDVSQPRIDYFRKSTNNGSTFGPPVKLPGQNATFRGDYMYMAARGTNVYITTTDVSNGHILLWVSTNSGTSFAAPKTIGTTTAKDNVPGQTNGACPCGYTGGFTGLPAVATNGTAIGIAYTATATGAEKIAICNTGGTGCTTSTVQSSGANANAGYSQAAGDATRMVFTWTTPAGAFSDVWTGGTGGSFLGKKTITTFPDANFAGTACASSTTPCNQAGEGAIPVLLGTTGIGIALSECNTVSGVSCDQTQVLEKSRAILVWYSSTNNGGSYGTHALIQAGSGATKNPTWMSEFGSIANIGGAPYILYAGHDEIYGAYNVRVKKCTGC